MEYRMFFCDFSVPDMYLGGEAVHSRHFGNTRF